MSVKENVLKKRYALQRIRGLEWKERARTISVNAKILELPKIEPKEIQMTAFKISNSIRRSRIQIRCYPE